MALNLSTLTSPANSSVLEEVNTTADFLENVPVLKNLSRGSNKGGDAKQGTALNQPKALPLDANGKGYLYLSGVSGNYADVPVFDMGALDDFTIQIDGLDAGSVRPATTATPISYFGAANTNRAFILQISTTGQIKLYLYLNGTTGHNYNDSTAVPTNTIGIRVTRVGTVLTYWVDTGSGYVSHDTDTVPTTPLYNPASVVSVNVGQYSGGDRLIGKIGRAVIWNNGTQAGDPVLDVDFTATNIRHNDTKFKCATGQVVTINQSGNDPATVIKKSVLRFDGADDGLKGLFNQTITDGYMFAAFSVLGDGGEAWGRIISVNKTGVSNDYTGGGMMFSYRADSTNNLETNKGFRSEHVGLFDSSNGDILSEAKATQSTTLSRVNNADEKTTSAVYTIEGDEFNIGQGATGLENACFDLEFLALFSADSVPDEATAKRIRDYINGRGANPIFTLIDSAGYYFYDAQSAPVGAISSGSSAWSGRIVGSDNGDSASLLATQETANHQPVSDGYTVTFADSNDHLHIPSISQSGWQIVGTSLGTFAYRINGTTAIGELNLLGNLGSASYRKAGQSYGMILLPDSATGADIEAARKLLIDRGAAEGFTGSNLYSAWYQRGDIVEFKGVPMPEVTDIRYTFASQTALVSFPAMSFPALILASNAWQGNTSMSDFGAIQAPLGNNFSYAWKDCSSLQQFPAGAKLGTSATNVNFTEAWRESGLTSFNTDLPTGTNFEKTWRQSALTSFGSIDLSSGTSFTASWQSAASLSSFGAVDARNGTTFQEAWRNTTALTSFPSGAKLGTAASNVNFTSAWRDSGLTSFPAGIDLSKATTFTNTWRQSGLTSFPAIQSTQNGTTFLNAWYNCASMTSFGNANLDNGGMFQAAWQSCYNLEDFPALFNNWNPSTITTGVFTVAWDACNKLTAQSVENILTSIDASGKYATTNGASGGTALGDAGIDIDYNAATGSLSAATNAAVTSLKAKGWSIIVNNVTL